MNERDRRNGWARVVEVRLYANLPESENGKEHDRIGCILLIFNPTVCEERHG
jgi:hypothetical protein